MRVHSFPASSVHVAVMSQAPRPNVPELGYVNEIFKFSPSTLSLHVGVGTSAKCLQALPSSLQNVRSVGGVIVGFSSSAMIMKIISNI